MAKQKLVIYLSGGLVDVVVSEVPVDVVVVDGDTEGVDENEIVRIDGEDRTVTDAAVEINPAHIHKVFRISNR